MTVASSAMSFYTKNCKKIEGITRFLDKVQIPKNEFAFSQDDLRKMYFYGSPFKKTWLSVAASLERAFNEILKN